MTVRARILFLLSILVALFLTGALMLRASEFQRVRQLSENDRQEKTLFFTKILDLQGASLEALAYDYTYWDEMVQFVGSHDPKWASQNLDSALSTYKTDGIWIYSPKQTLVYSTCSGGHDGLKKLPVMPKTLLQAFSGHHFCHFFLPTRQGVVEIRGGDIHATKDEKRIGRSFGFFLTGRLLDAAYLQTLTDLTASHVSLRLLQSSEAAVPADHDDDDVFDFYRSLPNWEGRPLAYLHLAAESRNVHMFRTSSAHMMALILVFLTILMFLLSLCLLQWISSPLQLISRSLRTQRPETIQALRGQKTEFGALAQLIERFFAQKAELEAAHDQLEMRVAERTAELADANHLLENAYTATIMGWSRAMDLRDHETEGHCQRVTELTLRLARRLELPENDLVPIRRGALLHDIGKMGVPDGILRKPGPLTEEEWQEMRLHPIYAYEMLSPITFLHSSLDIPWCHHEKWDGSGYPRGLKGEAIPLAARMFALVDVWDALCSDRPYRKGLLRECVVEHIRSLAGSHFDPCLVPHFLALLESEAVTKTPQSAGFPRAA